MVFSYVPICGRCVQCQSGRPALCENAVRANTAGTLLTTLATLLTLPPLSTLALLLPLTLLLTLPLSVLT